MNELNIIEEAKQNVNTGHCRHGLDGKANHLAIIKDQLL